MRVLVQNPTNSEVLKDSGSPSDDTMIVEVLDLKLVLILLYTVQEQGPGTYEDYVKDLWEFEKEGNGTVRVVEMFLRYWMRR